jgi:NAD(P)-dependent dehydrogenase (short-subunit alcohol dehydrogenase family)
MTQTVAVVTNATRFAGPAAYEALVGKGYTVVVHDDTFVDDGARQAFAVQNPSLKTISAQDREAIIAEASSYGPVDVLVSNDWIPWEHILGTPFEESTVANYEILIRELVYRPYELIRAAVGSMKERRSGRIILLTSATAARPLAGAPLYSSARAAATTLATAMAKRLGPYNIQVNSIGPNYFENPTYFPPGIWEENADLREEVTRDVPLQRLGTQEEMGALIAFLASGEATPVTGQFFGFAGGWLP